jgi:hypothetical protein
MRSGFDTFLLIYIAVFFVLEAVLLRRRTWLGRAMLGKCLALALLFGYAAVAPFWTGMTKAEWFVLGVGVTVTEMLRTVLAVAITAAVVALIWFRTHGLDPFEHEQVA